MLVHNFRTPAVCVQNFIAVGSFIFEISTQIKRRACVQAHACELEENCYPGSQLQYNHSMCAKFHSCRFFNLGDDDCDKKVRTCTSAHELEKNHYPGVQLQNICSMCAKFHPHRLFHLGDMHATHITDRQTDTSFYYCRYTQKYFHERKENVEKKNCKLKIFIILDSYHHNKYYTFMPITYFCHI